MKNENWILFMLAVTQFTHIVDFMIVMPLGSQFMEIFGISPGQFSWIVSIYALSAFFSGFFGAMYIDRFDRKQVLIFCYVGFILGTFACALTTNYWLLLSARAFTGMFGGVLGALVLAIVADITPFERRGRSMGIIMTAFSVASVVGVPISLWLAAHYGWKTPFIAIGLIATGTMLLMLRFMPSLTKHLAFNQSKAHPIDALKNIFSDNNQINALVFSIVLILGHFTIIPFIAPYMELNVGFTKLEIPYIYFVGGLLTAVLLPLAGRLSDKVGHIKVFAVSSFFALGSIYAITNLPAVSMLVAIIVTSSYFVVASGRNVPATTMVTSVVDEKSRASFMSIRASANEFALFLGSLIAGSIIKENTDGSLLNYEYVGYVAILMSIFAVLLATRLKLKTNN